MGTFFLLLFMGIIGITAKVLIKIKSLKERTKSEKVDMEVTGTKFLLDEWISIAISFLAVVIAAILYQYNLHLLSESVYNFVVKFNLLLFIAVGYMGSDILIKVLGVTEKAANKAVDEALNKVKDVNTITDNTDSPATPEG